MSGPFVCRCLSIPILLRFHAPLIEPDRRISRIRLTEETSRFRPRKAVRSLSKANKTKPVVQDCCRKSPSCRPCHFVFGTQPLTQPLAGVLIYCPVGFANRPKTEVVGPAVHHLIEPPHHGLMIQQGSIASSLTADRLTDGERYANHRSYQVGVVWFCRLGSLAC